MNGMTLSYEFYLLSTKLQAPSIKIYTASASTRRTSIFVWTPGTNRDIAGGAYDYTYHEWVYQTMTETTGTTEPWPVGPAGGNGFWCSQSCYLDLPLAAGVNAGSGTRRTLETFVNGLLAQPAESDGFKAINDAVIVGFTLGLGSGENNVVAFVRNYHVTTSDGVKNWDWDFVFDSDPSQR